MIAEIDSVKKKLPKRKVNTQRRFHNAKCVTSIFPSIKAHWEERMQYRRQSGSSVPDSWLNFRWTLSNWRVRTNSCGTIADELSLSKLSFRLLWNRQQSKKKWSETMNEEVCKWPMSLCRCHRDFQKPGAAQWQIPTWSQKKKSSDVESTESLYTVVGVCLMQPLCWTKFLLECVLVWGRKTHWGLSWLCLWLLMGGSAALLLNSSPFLNVSLICSVSVNTAQD